MTVSCGPNAPGLSSSTLAAIGKASRGRQALQVPQLRETVINTTDIDGTSLAERGGESVVWHIGSISGYHVRDWRKGLRQQTGPTKGETMTPEVVLTRRKFLAGSALAARVVIGDPGWPAIAAETHAGSSAQKPLVIDCHAHLAFRKSPEELGDEALVLDAADKLGIDKLCCSVLPKRPATVEGFQAANRIMAAAARRHPDRFLGYCFVNPGWQREALDEIRRCVEQFGFIGVKLYNEHFCTDPVAFPLVELAISLGVPILHHAGHSHYPVVDQPRISNGGHLAQLAKRYPEAKLICAHIGGGGDWEWTIKALRHAKNVCLDTSGSVVDEGIVDMAVKALGAERVLFACDMSFTAGVGKLRAAQLTDDQRRMILGGNMLRLLQKRGESR